MITYYDIISDLFARNMSCTCWNTWILLRHDAFAYTLKVTSFPLKWFSLCQKTIISYNSRRRWRRSSGKGDMQFYSLEKVLIFGNYFQYQCSLWCSLKKKSQIIANKCSTNLCSFEIRNKKWNLMQMFILQENFFSIHYISLNTILVQHEPWIQSFSRSATEWLNQTNIYWVVLWIIDFDLYFNNFV